MLLQKSKMLQCMFGYKQDYEPRLHLIGTDRVISSIEDTLIWKQPVYKFTIPNGLDEKNNRMYKEIYIDVTDSAPSFPGPLTALSQVLDKTVKLLSKKNTAILDFGAGKLRNTIYLLEKGYTVCAVEFEKMYGETQHAKDMYDRAQTHKKRFHKLVFPHQFFASDQKFDLVLLINVCSVMPVPSERLLVLQYCREKLNEEGLVLWYSMHKDGDYVKRCVPEVKMGDGFHLNNDNRYQTFYRDFEAYEIDGMFLASGFRLVDKFTVSHNHARIYKKIGNNPTRDIIYSQKIRQHVKGDMEYEEKKDVGIRKVSESDQPQENIPNPDILRDENFYIEALNKLGTGRNHALEYHNLITAVLIKLFMPPLDSYKIEKEVDESRKRIDIFMRNTETDSFFKRLITHHKIHAPYIMIECKNYEIEIKNEQWDQLGSRLNDKRGNFGILTYRKTNDESKSLKHCRDFLNNEKKFIITLSDKDIISMLNIKLAEESVDDYMEDKMEQLLS